MTFANFTAKWNPPPRLLVGLRHDAARTNSNNINARSCTAGSRHTTCIPMPASPTPTQTTSTHRWSTILPPETGLTFAAIWDPDDGMVTFTGAELQDLDLLERLERLGDSPTDATGDQHSQVLTIDRFAAALREGALGNADYSVPNTAVLALDQMEVDSGSCYSTSSYNPAARCSRQGPGHATRTKARPIEFACGALSSVNNLFETFPPSPPRSASRRTSWSAPRPLARAPQSNVNPRPSSGGSFHRFRVDTIIRATYCGADVAFIDNLNQSCCQEVQRDQKVSMDLLTPDWRPGRNQSLNRNQKTTSRSPSPFSGQVINNGNLKSAFSVTTTSTSRYIDVTSALLAEYEDDDSEVSVPEFEGSDASSVSSWSALETDEQADPNVVPTAGYRQSCAPPPPVTRRATAPERITLSNSNCTQLPQHRKLHKPNPSKPNLRESCLRLGLGVGFHGNERDRERERERCAKPSTVLARSQYNHEVESSQGHSSSDHSDPYYAQADLGQSEVPGCKPAATTTPMKFLKDNFGFRVGTFARLSFFPKTRRKDFEDERWVNVEVHQMLTQRLV